MSAPRVTRTCAPLCFLPFALPRSVQTRCYSASNILRADAAASEGNGGDTKPGVPAAPAPAGGSTARTFWVQLKGDVGFAKLVTSAADVGDLVKEIKKELELTQRTSSLVLQLASADGALLTAKDATGSEQPVTLDSMDTIDEALKKAAGAAGRTIGDKDKLRIIVDVPSARAS